MPAAELAAWARIDGLTPADVAKALWETRLLVKTWAMRGTLHLLPAADLPLYVAAREATPVRRVPAFFRYHGLTPAEAAEIMAGIPVVLGVDPLTREQLGDAVAARSGNAHLSEVLRSGWGILLKPCAFRGELCFGPNRGQKVTFVRPDLWLAVAPRLDAETGILEMARRYLRAYGPATPVDFARWWGTEASQAKKCFRSLGDEVTPVRVEGWTAWALSDTVEMIRAEEPARAVRLLPQFDAYVVGTPRDCEGVLPKAYKGRIYRPQGWIWSTVLVDGRIAGTWDMLRRGGRHVVSVSGFRPFDERVRAGLLAEAARLTSFVGSPVDLRYEDESENLQCG